MSPEQFKREFLGEFKPDPMAKLSISELRKIETSRVCDQETKRMARKLRQLMEYSQ